MIRNLSRIFVFSLAVELTYYSTQFNSVELNATYKHSFPNSQYLEWHDHTMKGFMFFPRLAREITDAPISGFNELTELFVSNVSLLGEKLDCVFAVMGDKFDPERFSLKPARIP